MKEIKRRKAEVDRGQGHGKEEEMGKEKER